MKISFHNLFHQYLIGAIINLLFLLFLYSFDTSYKNIQLPVGQYENNIWKESDVMSYVRPAMNYLEYGVFGDKLQAEHLRSIGYPAIISFFCWMFGKNWLLAFQLFQCILFALIYPVNTLIAKELLPSISRRTISLMFAFLLISGTYFIKPMVILTDTFFVLLFNIGFYLGLRTFKIQSNSLLIAYITCITIAGIIRPILTIFPLINLAIAFFVIKREQLSIYYLWKKIILTTIILAFTCNLTCFRNYINYGFVSPGSFAGGIYIGMMTSKILMGVNKPELYKAYLKEWEGMSDINKKTKFSKDVMEKTIMQYPIMTLKVLISNCINVGLDNHLISGIGNYFNYNWKVYTSTGLRYCPENPYSANSSYPYKRSLFCYYSTYFMMFVYFVFWLSFIWGGYSFIRAGNYEYAILISVLLFVLLMPGIGTGNSGSRYRLPFESFLIILSFYQMSKMNIVQSFKTVIYSWTHWFHSWTFGVSQLTGQGRE